MRSKETRKRVRTAVATAVKRQEPVRDSGGDSRRDALKSTERWNKEWLAYLGREFEVQLAPYTDYPDQPPLPDDPEAMITVSLGQGLPLNIYAEGAWIENRRLLEVGCGCGYLGKLIARYAESYL